MNGKIRKRLRGYSAVEFTLALPLLLFFVGIMSEFGNVFIQYTTLTKAVQDGAQWALKGRGSEYHTLDNTGSDEYLIALPSQIRNVVVYGNIGGTGDPVLQGLSDSDVSIELLNSDYYVVSVSYSYTPFWISFPYLSQNLNFNLSASSVVRN